MYFPVRCCPSRGSAYNEKFLRDDSATTRRSKANVLWAIMSVHCRMDEFTKEGYKSHRIVATALSDFVMQNQAGHVTTVAGYEAQMADVLRQLKALKKS